MFDFLFEIVYVFFTCEQKIQNEVRRLQNPRFLSIIVQILKGFLKSVSNFLQKKMPKRKSLFNHDKRPKNLKKGGGKV